MNGYLMQHFAHISEKGKSHGGHNETVSLDSNRSTCSCPSPQPSVGICGMDTTDMKTHLKHHIATIHDLKQPFECNLCNSKFSQQGSLNLYKKS